MKRMTVLMDGEPVRYTDLTRLTYGQRPPVDFDVAEALPLEMAQPLVEWCRERHIQVEELPVT